MTTPSVTTRTGSQQPVIARRPSPWAYGEAANFCTQIDDASFAVASLADVAAIFVAVPSVVQPPAVKPTTIVTTAIPAIDQNHKVFVGL